MLFRVKKARIETTHFSFQEGHYVLHLHLGVNVHAVRLANFSHEDDMHVVNDREYRKQLKVVIEDYYGKRL